MMVFEQPFDRRKWMSFAKIGELYRQIKWTMTGIFDEQETTMATKMRIVKGQ